jgi:F-box and leucine-rich repeat protein 14
MDNEQAKNLAEKLKAARGEIQYIDVLNNLDAIFDIDASFERIDTHWEIGKQLQDHHLKPLLKLKNLKKLILSVCQQLTDDGVQVLAGVSSSLEEIDFGGCFKLSDQGFRVLAALTSLKKVNLERCRQVTDSTLQVLSTLSKLEEINITLCDRISSKGLQFFIASLPNLQKLTMYSCSQLTDEGLVAISKFPALRELKLGECDKVTATTGFRHLAANCKNLANLDIHQVSSVNDDVLDSISQLPQLDYLRLASCNNFTGQGLKNLAKAPALKKLKLDSCNSVTFETLQNLLGAPVLETVDVSYCSVTNEQQEAFLVELRQNQEKRKSDLVEANNDKSEQK